MPRPATDPVQLPAEGVHYSRALPAALLRRLATALTLGLLVALWYPAAVHVESLWRRNSDHAWQVLAAADMLKGNWKLSGWVLTPFSSWTSELLFYAFAVAVKGVDPLLMGAVPVGMYLLVIVTGSWLAGFGLEEKWRLPVRVGFALVLALPTPFQAAISLQPISRMGTVLGCLLAFGLAAIAVRSARPLLPAAGAGAALFLAVVGDGLAAPAGIIPVLLAAPLIGWRTGRWRAAALVFAAGALAAGAGELVRELLPRIGGFTYIPLDTQRVHLHQLPRNLGMLNDSVWLLFGADALGGAPVAWAVAGLLLAGTAAVVAWTAWRTIWPRAGRPDALEVVLALGVVVDVAAFTLTDRPYDLMSARYLMPGLVASFILLARAATRVPRAAAGGVLASAAAVVLVHGAVAPDLLRAEPAQEPTMAVSDWLLGHGLKRGYAPYWEANLMTVESKGRLQVLPVLGQDDGIASYHYLSREDWYRDSSAGGGTRFVVVRDIAGDPANPDPSVNYGLSEDLAVRAFGPPAGTASVEHYRVLYWNFDLTPRVK